MVTLNQYPHTATLQMPPASSKGAGGFVTLTPGENVEITGRFEKINTFAGHSGNQSNASGDNLIPSGVFYSPKELPVFIAGMKLIIDSVNYDILNIIPYSEHAEIYIR